MITKKRLLTGMFLLSFIFALTMVSAAITFNNPSTTGETINGTITFNLTTTLSQASNCTWSITEDGVINITTNKSVGQTEFNFTMDTSILTDAEDTTLSANCTNGSMDSEYGTLVINIDNTAPVCAFNLNIGEETVEYLSGVGIYPIDSSSDTTDLTYAWTLWDPSGNSQTTSTSSTPNFAGDSFDEVGQDFTLGLTVTDEALHSNVCTNKTISVVGTNDDVTPSSFTTLFKEDKTSIWIIIGIIGFLIIIVAAFLVIKGAKK